MTALEVATAFLMDVVTTLGDIVVDFIFHKSCCLLLYLLVGIDLKPWEFY